MSGRIDCDGHDNWRTPDPVLSQNPDCDTDELTPFLLVVGEVIRIKRINIYLNIVEIRL